MAKIYIAGPMRGIPEFNFPAFHAAEADLKSQGHEVFSPARRDIERGFDPAGMTGSEDLSSVGFSLREALADDLEWICLHADKVVLLPGWENSKGVAAERAAAHAIGILIEVYTIG